MISKSEIVIFYSWQSDLPDNCNRELIKEAINNVITRLEKSHNHDKLHIILDEATRGKAGSPNIPMTIFDKIQSADIFICDITTINSNTTKGLRRVPNPNVMIELGYAIAHLGWERVVMIFNESFGQFPEDTPFDIDRHRTFLYTSIENTDEQQEINEQFISSLLENIETIITQNPLRPKDITLISIEKRKHNHDMKVIKKLLSTINIPAFDQFLNKAPRLINDNIFHFWEGFNGIVDSNQFHLYDKHLAQLITIIHEEWENILSYGHRYYTPPNSTVNLFNKAGDLPFDDDEQKDWDSILKAIQILSDKFHEMLIYTRENYVEIEIDKLSEMAGKEYKNFMRSNNN